MAPECAWRASSARGVRGHRQDGDARDAGVGGASVDAAGGAATADGGAAARADLATLPFLMPPPTNSMSPGIVFFFFQAEDGIRDLTVTGVQTCALPIFEEDDGELVALLQGGDDLIAQHQVAAVPDHDEDLAAGVGHLDAQAAGNLVAHAEIGRASCRERV